MSRTVSNFGPRMLAWRRITARTPSAEAKYSACASWLSLFGPMPRLLAIWQYQSMFAGEEAKNATPAPANVIFDVELIPQKRFGWLASAA